MKNDPGRNAVADAWQRTLAFLRERLDKK